MYKILLVNWSQKPMMKETFTIYRITNIKTGKIYIGQTKRNVHVRYTEHCANSIAPHIKNNRPLCWDMYTYGLQNFKLDVIATTYTQQQAWDLEAFYIAYYNSYRFGNNNNPGNIKACKEEHPVLCVEMYTLNIFNEYKSVDAAAEFFGVPDAFIYRCCTNLGYVYKNKYWCYKENYDLLVAHYKNKQITHIIQIDNVTKEILHTFENVEEVAQLYNDSPINIAAACCSKKTLHGFLWRYL